jgi:hypothetical protein
MSIENEELDTGLDVALDDDVEIVVDESYEEPVAEESAEPEAQAEESAEPEAEEAPAPEAEAQGEEDPDAELAAMPDKVKKRFMREKRLRDGIIQEREQIREVAIKVATLAKQREDEVGQLKRQNAALQKQFAETLDYAYERDISITATEIRRAKEDGNYDNELKLQGDLDKLRFQQNQLRQVRATLPEPDSASPTPQAQSVSAPAPQQQAAPQQQKAPPAPLAVKWINNNKSWFLDPKFKAHHNFVRTVDAEIVAEGYDPQSPEYYKELDRRVDSAFPSLRKRTKPAGSPVGAVGAAPASNTSSRTIKLGKSDIANMRRYGLDPTNKEHLREYARSKRAA